MCLQFGGVEHLRCFLLNGNGERCEEGNLSFSIFFLILNLCFPQNIFYKISFPTRYVAEDLPSLACQLFLSARPRSLHTPTEGTSYEGRSGNFSLLAHSRRNQKDTWDCTASQREFLFEP